MERYTQDAKLLESIYVSIRAIVLGYVADTVILAGKKILSDVQTATLTGHTTPVLPVCHCLRKEQVQGRVNGADTADPSKTAS